MRYSLGENSHPHHDPGSACTPYQSATILRAALSNISDDINCLPSSNTTKKSFLDIYTVALNQINPSNVLLSPRSASL